MIDDEWAETVEAAAIALAKQRGDTCFSPLRDTAEWQEHRDRYRTEARAALDAVDHRAIRDEVAKVNALLRENGFLYPLGARGVSDALGMLRMVRADVRNPEYLRGQLAYLEAET